MDEIIKNHRMVIGRFHILITRIENDKLSAWLEVERKSETFSIYDRISFLEEVLKREKKRLKDLSLK